MYKIDVFGESPTDNFTIDKGEDKSWAVSDTAWMWFYDAGNKRDIKIHSELVKKIVVTEIIDNDDTKDALQELAKQIKHICNDIEGQSSIELDFDDGDILIWARGDVSERYRTARRNSIIIRDIKDALKAGKEDEAYIAEQMNKAIANKNNACI